MKHRHFDRIRRYHMRVYAKAWAAVLSNAARLARPEQAFVLSAITSGNEARTVDRSDLTLTVRCASAQRLSP